MKNVNSAGIELIQSGNNHKTIELLSSQTSLYEARKNIEKEEALIYNHLLAQAYQDVSKYEESINHAFEGASLMEKFELKDSLSFDYMYFLDFITHGYSRLNDNYKSILHCIEAIKFNEEHDKDQIANLSYYNTLALNWSSLNNTEMSVKCYKKSIQATKKLPPEFKYYTAYILQNLSKNLWLLNKPDSSLLYLEQSINFQEKYPEIFEKDFFSLYATAANRHLALGNDNEARAYFAKAEEHFHQDAPITEIAYFHQVRAKLLLEEGKFEKALENIEVAKEKLGRKDARDKMRSIYPREYLGLIETELDIYESQFKKSFDVDHLEIYLTKSRNQLRQAQSMIQHLPSDALKSALITHIKPVYRHILHAAWLGTQYGNKVSTSRLELIHIYETYQAQLINQEINRNTWMREGHLSKEEKTKFQSFEQQYDSLLHATYQLEISDDIKSPYSITTHELYRFEDSIRNLQITFRNQYPEFNDILEQQEAITHDEITLLLKQQGSILSFFQDDDEIYTLLLQPGKHKLDRIEYTTNMQETLHRWYNALSNTNKTVADKSNEREDLMQFHQDGRNLYNLFQQQLNSIDQNVLIIPDGDISNVSFSALNRHIPNEPYAFKEADYLIEDYVFETHFSMKLTAKMLIQKNKTTSTSASFTPAFVALKLYNPITADSIYLPALPYSLAESKTLIELFNGKNISAEQDIHAIVNQMKHHRILHIGSHVVLNHDFTDQSYIPISDPDGLAKSIKPYELFKESIGSDLVIVNSCHSGNSKSAMGRGLLSFVSGFVRADAKCILSSRWAVQDKAGSEFMTGIFEYLSEGQSIAKALHQTQLQRLHQNDPILSHPSNWASYYLMGDGDLTVRDSKGIYWALGALLLLFTVFYWKIKS